MSPTHTECWALALRSGGTEPTSRLTQLWRAVFHQNQSLWPPEGGAPTLFPPESNSDTQVICSGLGYQMAVSWSQGDRWATGAILPRGRHVRAQHPRPSQLLPQTSDKQL